MQAKSIHCQMASWKQRKGQTNKRQREKKRKHSLNPFSSWLLSQKYWVVASILGFLVHKKYTLTLLWYENFFSLIRSSGVSKNLSFHTDFKNVHMTLEKVHPKKVLPKKPIFLGLGTMNFFESWKRSKMEATAQNMWYLADYSDHTIHYTENCTIISCKYS